MFYTQFYVLVITANVISIWGAPSSGIKRSSDEHLVVANKNKINHNIKENRKELKRIIKILNGQLDEEEGITESKTLLKSHYGADPQETAAVERKQIARIKGLLKMLQSKYDARYNDPKDSADSRIHIIANPEVIDDFNRVLRKKYQSTSSSSGDSETDSFSDLTFYRHGSRKQINDLASNEMVNGDEDPLQAIIYLASNPRAAKAGQELIAMNRVNRRGLGRKRKNQASSDLDKSNEDFQGYKGTDLSWKELLASHERFNIQKSEKKTETRQEPYRGAIKKSPQSKIFMDSPEITNKRKREKYAHNVPGSFKGWKSPNALKLKRLRYKKKNQDGSGIGRTLIPSAGKRGIYEDD